MNGRVYDPQLGRFLSADPFVQSPTSSQNYNRYSYALNNPLKYTDPSGYFLKKLFKGIKRAFKSIGRFFKKYGRMIAAIAFAAIVGPAVAGWIGGFTGALVGGAVAGFGSSFIMTGSVSAAFKGALFGAIAGGLAWQIGHGAIGRALAEHAFAGVETIADLVEAIKYFQRLKTIAHGIAQGLVSVARGGSFKSGLIGGVVGHGVGEYVENAYPGNGWSAVAAKTTVISVAGGTASVMGGGKFANGAASAGFTHLFNYWGIDDYYKAAHAEALTKIGEYWGKATAAVGSIFFGPKAAAGAKAAQVLAVESPVVIGSAVRVQQAATSAVTAVSNHAQVAAVSAVPLAANPAVQQNVIDTVSTYLDHKSLPAVSAGGAVGYGLQKIVPLEK